MHVERQTAMHYCTVWNSSVFYGAPLNLSKHVEKRPWNGILALAALALPSKYARFCVS